MTPATPIDFDDIPSYYSLVWRRLLRELRQSVKTQWTKIVIAALGLVILWLVALLSNNVPQFATDLLSPKSLVVVPVLVVFFVFYVQALLYLELRARFPRAVSPRIVREVLSRRDSDLDTLWWSADGFARQHGSDREALRRHGGELNKRLNALRSALESDFRELRLKETIPTFKEDDPYVDLGNLSTIDEEFNSVFSQIFALMDRLNELANRQLTELAESYKKSAQTSASKSSSGEA